MVSIKDPGDRSELSMWDSLTVGRDTQVEANQLAEKKFLLGLLLGNTCISLD